MEPEAAADAPGPDAEGAEAGFEGEEEEGGELTSRLLQIFFWTFLVLFLAAGLLWQLEILNFSARAPAEAPALSPPPGEGTVPPEQEKPAKPDPEPKESQVGENTPPVSPPTRRVSDSQPLRRLAQPISRSRPATTRPQMEVSPSDHRLYAVHVSSHKIKSLAEREAQTLRRKQYSVTIKRVNIPGKGLFYRVLVGRFPSRQQALQTARKLKGQRLTSYTGVLSLPASPRSKTQIARTDSNSRQGSLLVSQERP